jgi:hypothetical protein
VVDVIEDREVIVAVLEAAIDKVEPKQSEVVVLETEL